MRWFAQKNFMSWSKSLSISIGKPSNSGEKTLWTRWKRAEYHSVILPELVVDHSFFIFWSKVDFTCSWASGMPTACFCHALQFFCFGHPRFDPSIWRCWVSICCWMWKPVMNECPVNISSCYHLHVTNTKDWTSYDIIWKYLIHFLGFFLFLPVSSRFIHTWLAERHRCTSKLEPSAFSKGPEAR